MHANNNLLYRRNFLSMFTIACTVAFILVMMLGYQKQMNIYKGYKQSSFIATPVLVQFINGITRDNCIAGKHNVTLCNELTEDNGNCPQLFGVDNCAEFMGLIKISLTHTNETKDFCYGNDIALPTTKSYNETITFSLMNSFNNYTVDSGCYYYDSDNLICDYKCDKAYPYILLYIGITLGILTAISFVAFVWAHIKLNEETPIISLNDYSPFSEQL